MNLIFLLLNLFFSANNSIPHNNVNCLNSFTSTSDTIQQPDIYIHFDKEIYNPGEYVWFKAYLFNDLFPATQESDFTIRLYNDDGKLIASKSYPVLNATGIGEFQLADTLRPGIYQLRAAGSSTSAPEQVYKKDLLVGYSPPAEFPKEPLSFEVYPEGQAFFDNRNSVTAIRISAGGYPVKAKGRVLSDTGQVIGSFETGDNGFAKVNLKLSAGINYYASVIVEGKEMKYYLPEVQKEGVQLFVEENKIIYIKNMGLESQEGLVLRCTMHNQTLIESPVSLIKKELLKLTLKPEDLPAGIMIISLLKNGKVVTQRKMLIKYPQSGSAGITVKNIRNDKNVLNKLELTGLPAGSYSISVTNADNNGSFLHEDIYSRLLLLNQNYSEAFSNYIFNSNRTDSIQLDNLLLSSPITESPVLKKAGVKKPVFFTLSGVVQNPKTNAPMSGGQLQLFIVPVDTSAPSFYQAKVDADGKFKEDSIIFYGKNKFYYNYYNEANKEKSAVVTFNRMDKQDSSIWQFRKDSGTLTTSSSLYNSFIKEGSTQTTVTKVAKPKSELDTVFIKSRKNRQVDKMTEKYMSGSMFSSGGKVVLDNINNPVVNKTINLQDYLLQSIRTIQIAESEYGGLTFVNSRLFSLFTGKMWEIDVYVDDKRSSLVYLQTIRMDNVAFIKFYNGSSAGTGSSAPGGIIAVYLKKPADYKTETPSWLSSKKFIELQGYDIAKTFNEDIYKTAQTSTSTLYWKPEVLIEDKNKLDIEFSNPLKIQKLRLRIEGFDIFGRLVHCDIIINQ